MIVRVAVAQPNIGGTLPGSPRHVTMRPAPAPAPLPLGARRDDGHPRIALVLSGGGSRGFAQIGVLKVFEEAGIPIHAIVGTSIGGLVGGLYADGYSAHEIDSIVRATDWNDLLGIGEETRRDELFIDQKLENDRSLLTLRLDGLQPMVPEAISTGSRMTQFLENLVWDGPYHGPHSFDELKYRFRAIATDLVRGRSVVLDRGNLALAMRASATVPLRFTPVALDSMLLVDGGLLDNIPVEPARQLGCDVIVVVNTTSPLIASSELNTPWNVADQVVTLMMKQQNHDALAAADIVITPTLGGLNGTDFTIGAAAIDSGEAAARRMLPALMALLRGSSPAQQEVRNLGVTASDGRLLAALGYDERAATFDLGDLQHRLDRLGATGRFTGIAADLDISDDGAHLALSGEATSRIARVNVHGFSRIPRELADSAFLGLVGAPIDNDSIARVCEQATCVLRRAGYSFFKVDSIGTDYRSDGLDIYVQEGVIRRISIDGLDACAPFVVRRELEFDVGDLFEADAARKAANRLLRTGFFKDARVEAAPVDSGGLEVMVRVKERSTAVLRISAGIDNERYTQIGLEVAQENLFGQGTTLSGRIRSGLRDEAVSLDLRTNRIYGTYWTFGLSGYGGFRNVNSFERTLDQVHGVINRNITGEYREFRVGARARFGRQIQRFGLFTVEGRYERQGTRDLSVRAADVAWRGLSTLKLGARFDTQNRTGFATDGSVIDVAYETSQSIFGADASFVKLSVDAQSFVSIGKRNVLHPHLQLGFGDATLPLMEQFSLGGQWSMFGLREDESRGRQLFLTSLEYRVQLPVRFYFDTYVGVRYDLGGTWLAPSQIRLKDLEHGFGINLGLDTPVGPANFSLGRSFTFNKPDAPTFMNWGPIVAYFSLGYKFD